MSMTAEDQLDAFIDKYDPVTAKLGRSVLAHMRKRLPGAVELVYDNYNYLAVGFGPDERVKTLPISVALYPRWATLFLMQGAELDDSKGLLTGSGPLIRSMRIETLAALKQTHVDDLISRAVLNAGWTLGPKAKGRIVIKSVSAKQRPRRPVSAN